MIKPYSIQVLLMCFLIVAVQEELMQNFHT